MSISHSPCFDQSEYANAELSPLGAYKICPPDQLWTGGEIAYRPSWGRSSEFINEEHSQIFSQTGSIPGWQDCADSEKLYEIAYYNGGVILEIGIYAGRSAVVELRGALAGCGKSGGEMPQFYGVDLNAKALPRTRRVLRAHRLHQYAVLFHGNLAAFLRSIPIVPTMVFVDGGHTYGVCLSDLLLLGRTLAPGTPVLCHDYGIEDVQKAVDEAVATSEYYEFAGTFAGSALLRTTPYCKGVPRGLSQRAFIARRDGAGWRRWLRTRDLSARLNPLISAPPPRLRRYSKKAERFSRWLWGPF
jgi:hypothetical protein